MKYSCFFLLRVVYDTNQSRTQQAVADAISTTDFFKHLMVRQVTAVDALERFVDPGIKFGSGGFHRRYVQCAKHFFHLFDDELDARPQLFHGARRFEGEMEIVENGKELLHCASHREIAEVGALARFALAGVVELCLQARHSIDQLIALSFDTVKLRL